MLMKLNRKLISYSASLAKVEIFKYYSDLGFSYINFSVR